VTTGRVDELEIPADSRYVAAARNFVADSARAAGWLDEDQIDDLRLVASELVTNALRAQAHHALPAVITVRSVYHDDRFELSVADSAGGFDAPVAPPLPEPDLHREGGFGLPLIEALTDEAHFVRNGSGTTVRVVVYRPDPERRAG
jgi:serine/threonine-protein kinase RsbW